MCVLNHISFHMSNIIGSSRLLIKLQMCDLPDKVSTWKYFLILDLRSFWAAALYWNLVLLSLSRVVPICDGTRGLSAYQRRLLLLQPHGRCSENWPPQWKGDEFPTIIQGFFFSLSLLCAHHFTKSVHTKLFSTLGVICHIWSFFLFSVYFLRKLLTFSHLNLSCNFLN